MRLSELAIPIWAVASREPAESWLRSLAPLCVIALLAAALTLWKRRATAGQRLRQDKRERRILDAKTLLGSVRGERDRYEHLLTDIEQQLEAKRQYFQSQKQELEGAIFQRTIYQRKVYNIAVIGASKAGKSGLLRRLNDLYFQYSEYLPKTIGKEEYESVVRTVFYTRTRADGTDGQDKFRQEDVFHYIGWPGEQIFTASTELQALCDGVPSAGRVRGVHGLIFVVDLAAGSGNQRTATQECCADHITEQLRQLPEKYLRFLFRNPITNKLKLVMLYINKIDTINCPDIEEAKKIAEQLFKPLIDGIKSAYGTAPIVIVGSVKYDVAVAKVVSTLVQAIFPGGEDDLGIEPSGRHSIWTEKRDLQSDKNDGAVQ